MMWGFRFELRGRAGNWAASIIFMIAGAIILGAVAPLVHPGPDGDTARWAVWILGSVFLLLGSGVIVALVAGEYVRARRPEQAEAWDWWVNFLGGMVGAGLFAIPATLVLPAMLLAYALRPNGLFPANGANAGQNLLIGALFSAIGLICLGGMYWLGRGFLQDRPRGDAARVRKRPRKAKDGG